MNGRAKTVLGRLAAAPLVAFALVATLFSLVAVMGGAADAVEENRKVAGQLKETAAYVDRYRQQHARFPDLGPQVEIITPEYGIPDEAAEKVGRPPAGSYILRTWRGEWFDYYAPWSGRSSLSFRESDYYVLGNRYLDALVGALIALVSAATAWSLWKGNLWGRGVKPA